MVSGTRSRARKSAFGKWAGPKINSIANVDPLRAGSSSGKRVYRSSEVSKTVIGAWTWARRAKLLCDSGAAMEILGEIKDVAA